MSTNTHAPKRFFKHALDSIQYGYIFDDEVLPEGVTISSVSAPVIATVSGTSTTPLTVSGQVANGAAFTGGDDRLVAIGRAVRATTAGGTAGCVYSVTITITASNGEVYTGVWKVEVEG